MSSDIWTQCGAESNFRRLRRTAWRVVEDQHVSSTFKLVDSVEEHELLEDLLDDAKPPPPVPDLAGMHYLLFTPFRYPPLRHGSRFGSSLERGIWYGSARVDTALAESAYYLFLFAEGTEADLFPLSLRRLVFPARISTSRGIDLSAAPFEEHAARISHKSKYRDSQALGVAMRDAGVEAAVYVSARDPNRGLNLALLSPLSFASPNVPSASQQIWAVTLTAGRALFVRGIGRTSEKAHFAREQFTVEGELPSPAC